MQDVIKNLKDLIVLSLVVGVLSLLGVLIIDDYFVQYEVRNLY